MWRAVDKEGEVLDVLVQRRRNRAAALKLLRKLLKNQGFVPDAVVTDSLRSYPAAIKALGCQHRTSRADYEITTGSKTRIFQSDDESERCNASSPRVKPNASLPPTQQSTLPSTPNVISSHERQCDCSETVHLRNGMVRPLLRHENSLPGFRSPGGS